MTGKYSSKLRGFTILEVMLAITVLVIIASSTYVSFSNYYKTSVVDSELRLVKSILESARQQAIGNATGEAYSVKFLSSSYVIFPGTTYTENNPNNKSYPLNTTVIVDTSFTNELLTFNNFTGRAINAGTISLQAFGLNKQIVINQLGIVEDII